MRFKAQYIEIASAAMPRLAYWRTFDADAHEADKIALRMQRKGFRLVGYTQQYTFDVGREARNAVGECEQCNRD